MLVESVRSLIHHLNYPFISQSRPPFLSSLYPTASIMIIPFFSSVFTLLLASRVRGECQATTVANDIQAGQSATISSQTAAHVKAGGTVCQIHAWDH
jgi:hypothetical protein